MIIFVTADGTVQSVLPSPVYQGSSLNGGLYFVAPFPSNDAVDVAFELADGSVTPRYALTAVKEDLPDVVNKLGNEYTVWEWQNDNSNITAKSGMVTAQFRVLFGNNVFATAAVNFEVIKGVTPPPTKEPSADQWDTLIKLYSDLNARVPMKFMIDFTVNEETGIATKEYSDGTTATVKLPTDGGGTTSGGKGITTITFTEDSWTSVSGEENKYFIAFGAGQTGQKNGNFIVQIEEVSSETYRVSAETSATVHEGNTTLSDAVFKGSDGSIYIESTAKYSGRILTFSDAFKLPTNIQNGSGNYSIEQSFGDYSAQATGENAAAFGGKRFDKLTDASRTATSAEGNQSFAAGGSVHAKGDFSTAFGKDGVAYQKGSFAAAMAGQAGKSEADFNAYYWDATNNVALHKGQGKKDGKITDEFGKTYEESYSAAAVFGDGNEAKGYADFVAGAGNETDGVGNAAFGKGNSIESGSSCFVGGENNAITGDVGNSFVYGQGLKNDGRWNKVVIGQYNAPNSYNVFEFGAGTSDSNRKNVVEIKDDGAVILGSGQSFTPGTRFQVSSKDRKLIDTRNNGVTHIESYVDTLNASIGSGNSVNGKKISDPTQGNYSLLNTFMAGEGLENNGRYNQSIVGQYNEYNPNALFQVGTGESNSKRASGFEVMWNGRTKVKGKPVEEDDVVRLKELGYSMDFPHGGPTSVQYDTDDGMSITGTLRIYTKADKSEFRDVENVTMKVPMVAGDNVTMDADATNKKVIIKAAGGGGSIDADTLNNLLTGSNGISFAKNAAGDKVVGEIAVSETGPIVLTNTEDPRPAAVIQVINKSGPPHSGGIRCRAETSDSRYSDLGPQGILFLNPSESLSINLVANSIITHYAGQSVVGYGLISGGPKGNVKTLFGNQSIYGSGNIDLYRHSIEYVGSGTYIKFEYYSSSNLQVDSLTDLITLCGDSFSLTASGYVERISEDDTNLYFIYQVGNNYLLGFSATNSNKTISWVQIFNRAGGVFTDTVTTV